MGKAQGNVLVDSSIGAVSEDAAVNRYPGNVVSPQAVDDAFIQGLAVPFVVFSHVDPHQLGLTFTLERGSLRCGAGLWCLLRRFDDGGVLPLNQARTGHLVEFG